MFQVAVSVKGILRHLGDTDCNVGAVICYSLQTGGYIREDKSLFYGTFTFSQPADVAAFQLHIQFIDHLFQRFHTFGHLLILPSKYFVCGVKDILNRFGDHMQFLQCLIGEFHIF